MRIVFKNMYSNLTQSTGTDSAISPTLARELPLSIPSESYEAISNTQQTAALKVIYLKSEEDLLAQNQNIKRVFDIIFSLSIMVLGFPVFLLLCIITRCTSKGPIFFSQERMGRDDHKFRMYKFRSMYINSECNGPQLSKRNDPRITKWGRIIRRTRLDELPQFWNVLRGDMSVVGPRPERQYFIALIIKKSPEYKRLQKIKPGVTSLGQVHFGYAENVDEMCARMIHDLDYLGKISLRTDLNVILKTVKVMVQRKGK